MSARDDLLNHLQSGATTVCRAWSVLRRDGMILGFTDHDHDLVFDGTTFKASTGLTARALAQSTGLSVDNSEVVGALSDQSITEADVISGRFDAAEVRCWLLNWSDTSQRIEQFRGSFGEIQRSAGSFKAELRGLTEALNKVQGQVFQSQCPAILGDARCKFNLSQTGFTLEGAIIDIPRPGILRIQNHPEFAERWFERGRIRIISGPATGQIGLIRFDRQTVNARELELWIALGMAPSAGDIIRLEAGCDKLASTCRNKFNNLVNFRGFPDIPGEDWLKSYPVSSQINDGGQLLR